MYQFAQIFFYRFRFQNRLRELAFLNTGVKLILLDKRSSEEKKVEFKFEGGINEYVKYLNQSKKPYTFHTNLF